VLLVLVPGVLLKTLTEYTSRWWGRIVTSLFGGGGLFWGMSRSKVIERKGGLEVPYFRGGFLFLVEKSKRSTVGKQSQGAELAKNESGIKCIPGKVKRGVKRFEEHPLDGSSEWERGKTPSNSIGGDSTSDDRGMVHAEVKASKVLTGKRTRGVAGGIFLRRGALLLQVTKKRTAVTKRIDYSTLKIQALASSGKGGIEGKKGWSAMEDAPRSFKGERTKLTTSTI